MYSRSILISSIFALLCACASNEHSAPMRVQPASAESSSTNGPDHDSARDPSPHPVEDAAFAPWDAQETSTPPQFPGASDSPSPGGLWVVDALDEPVGLLVRRGSDDNLADRAIYDLVTLYHPESNLFFELTMSNAQPRYPTTTFFSSASCDTPVGISAGGCVDCRSGFRIGFVHHGAWWRVVGGQLFEQASAGSSQGGGIDGACTAHQTFNAKVFPVEEISGTTPAASWEAPLHFEWR